MKRPRWWSLCSLLCGALLSLGAAAPSAGAQQPAPEPLIPFEPLASDFSNIRGANYIPYWGSSSTAILSPVYANQVAQVLPDLLNLRNAGMNSIRFWLNYWAWLDSPTYYIAALRALFTRCEQLGIRVMPVLWDALFPLNVLPPDPRQAFDKWYPNPGYNYITNPLFGASFAQYVTEVVNAVKTSPALFAWDIMNEPIFGHPQYQPLDAWLLGNIQFVRSLDPNHPITIGFALPQFSTPVINQLDFLSFHPYGAFKENLILPLAIARQIAGTKPVLVTEGPGGPGDGQCYEDFLRHTEAAGVGVMAFESHVHIPFPYYYPYWDKTGFLFWDNTTRDPRAVQAYQALAQRQNGHVGPPVAVKPTTAVDYVPFFPMGQGLWAGFGGPELIDLLRNWSARYKAPAWPQYAMVGATNSHFYRQVMETTLGSLGFIGISMTPAERTAYDADQAAYNTAVTAQNWPAAETALQNMLATVLQVLARGNISNNQ